MPNNSYVPVQLLTMNGEEYRVYLKEDIRAYFSIPEAPVEGTAYKIDRAAHSRNVFTGLTADAKVKQVKVKQTIYEVDPDKRRKKRSGQKIKVPTELYTQSVKQAEADPPEKGNIRFVTINIPQGVRNYDIAMWIKGTFSAKTPEYFITASGARFSTTLAGTYPGTK